MGTDEGSKCFTIGSLFNSSSMSVNDHKNDCSSLDSICKKKKSTKWHEKQKKLLKLVKGAMLWSASRHSTSGSGSECNHSDQYSFKSSGTSTTSGRVSAYSKSTIGEDYKTGKNSRAFMIENEMERRINSTEDASRKKKWQRKFKQFMKSKSTGDTRAHI